MCFHTKHFHWQPILYNLCNDLTNVRVSHGTDIRPMNATDQKLQVRQQ